MSRPTRHLVAAAQPVLHVDRVVLAVGAEQAEEDRRPAPEAELLLLQRRSKPARARRSRSPRPRSAAPRSRTPGRAARRRAGQRDSPAPAGHRQLPAQRVVGRLARRAARPACRRSRPVKASLEPSPRTSTPARSRPGPCSSSRATTCCTGSNLRIRPPPTGAAWRAVLGIAAASLDRLAARRRARRSAVVRPWPAAHGDPVGGHAHLARRSRFGQRRRAADHPLARARGAHGDLQGARRGARPGERRQPGGRPPGRQARARRRGQGGLRVRARGRRVVGGRARPRAGARLLRREPHAAGRRASAARLRASGGASAPALLEVTEPRPAVLEARARRWASPRFLKRSPRPGGRAPTCAIVEEGELAAGDPVQVLAPVR